MAKKKRNYDITHKVMRVRSGDYAFLAEVSRKAGIPMAEALHLALELQATTRVSPAQIPMPAFQVAPMPEPAFRVASVITIATNGSKAAVFRIKPKGVRDG